jgi:hypothetical protein
MDNQIEGKVQYTFASDLRVAISLQLALLDLREAIRIAI